MPTYRVQVAMGADSNFARDAFMNTLHYVSAAAVAESELQTLCQNIATAYDTSWFSGALDRQYVVTAYEVGPPPNPPLATFTLNQGQFPASIQPREVALCLSYYSQQNVPRKRGRIYLPYSHISGQLGKRPTTTLMTKALDHGTALFGAATANTDWAVYSPTDGNAYVITNMWVDDEFDTVRRRQLRPETRMTRAVP